MSRSTPTIYQQALAAKVAQAALNGLNSASQVAIWNLWLWITAQSENLFEQYCDQFTALIESLILNAPVYSAGWIQSMILQFQYSASIPQYRNLIQVTLPDGSVIFTIGYTTVNPTLLVITQCAVQTTTNRSLYILIAGGTSSSPTVISPTILTSLEGDYPVWGIPGTEVVFNSFLPDQIYIQGQVFYNAAISGVIQANMNTAIQSYISGINFAGTFSVGQLFEAMMAVTGVTDVLLTNVWWRGSNNIFVPSGGPPPTNTQYSGQQLVLNGDWILNTYQMYAGYAIPESTNNYTLADVMIYTPS